MKIAVQFLRLGLVAALLAMSAWAQELPEVVVLTTGGTIASTKQSRESLSGQELVAAVPELRRVAKVRAEEIVRIGSRDITPAIWLRMLERAQQLLAQPEVAGLVVTHGTDTVEETAYFLDLTIASNKPVVFTARNGRLRTRTRMVRGTYSMRCGWRLRRRRRARACCW